MEFQSEDSILRTGFLPVSPRAGDKGKKTQFQPSRRKRHKKQIVLVRYDVCYNQSIHKERESRKKLLCLNEGVERGVEGRLQKGDI